MKNCYVLFINKSMECISKDKWLIELYLAQRGLVSSRFTIMRESYSNDVCEYDDYLIYYYGYSVTVREMRFIQMMNDEDQYQRRKKLDYAQKLLDNYGDKLSKKDIQAVKRTIKLIKKYKVDSQENRDSIIDTIINHKSAVDEYLRQSDFIGTIIDERLIEE